MGAPARPGPVSPEPVGGRGGRPYDVVAAEPDVRLRTRMTIELAGIVTTPVASLDAIAEAMRPPRPAVVLLGPSFATEAALAEIRAFARRFSHAGPVLLAESLTLPLLQAAVRAGVRDAVTFENGEVGIRQAIERVGDTMVALAGQVAPGDDAAALGRVFVTFSTKGGVGKSVISTNVAVALAAEHRDQVVLVDADLQFGDVAVLLGLPPVHTTVDAARAVPGSDLDLLAGVLAVHEPSSLRVLCAPIEPAAGEQIDPATLVGIVRLLRRSFTHVVVDMPPHFDDLVLALLDEADEVLLVASMDIPSIKNLKVGIQTLDLLAIAGSKLRLVLNRANARVNLDVADVERALGTVAEFRVPSDIAVPQAVNRGVPVVLDRPRAPAASALRDLAARLGGTEAPGAAPVPAPPAAEPDANPRRWRRSG